MYQFHFAFPLAFYILVPLLAIAALIRWRFSRSVVYLYPLTQTFINQGRTSITSHQKILAIARFLLLVLLLFLIAKPQLVDVKSRVINEGIDIMLSLDLSGSMNFQDNQDDPRSRFAIAKEEAIRFIQKRDNDAIGLVFFAGDAFTKLPLTLDKKLLMSVLQESDIGQDINPNATLLATSLLTALNRLKSSRAKSRIIIVLTDGEPANDPVDLSVPIAIAKEMGVKMYAIGIGGQEPKHIPTLLGTVIVPGVNKEILDHIAHETGGKSFMAHNARDMRLIYDTIDQLEKTEQDLPIFSTYYDIFMPFVFCAIALLVFELLITTFVWFGL